MFKVDELPFRRRTWVDLAAIPRNRRGWELSDCTEISEDVIARIEQWLSAAQSGKIILADGERACGRGLLFYGASGHGKTTLALATLQAVIRTFPLDAFKVAEGSSMARPAYFIQYTDLVDLRGRTFDDPSVGDIRLWEGIMGECKEDTYNIRVLVIDDVGREHKGNSDWSSNLLHQVLRTRFNNGLPTIVTSNHRLEDWGNTYGNHTESFAHEAFFPIPVKAKSGDLRK